MKIISWNTRGLGSRKKRRVVKDFLRLENPDVVMIQETKKVCFERRRGMYKYECYFDPF